MAAFWIIFLKDVRLELRTRQSLSTMVIFSVAVLLLFAFAIEADPTRFRNFMPGLMWMTYFFAAVLGLFRSFGQERELEAYSLLLSAPVNRTAIYLGKAAAFSLFMILTQIVSLPLFGLFLDMPLLVAPAALTLILVVVDIAIAAVGIIIAGMSLRSPAGEILLPTLLFPLLTPLLIAATNATDTVLAGRPFEAWDFWLLLIITYFALFILAGTFIFDYISEQ